MKRGATTLAVGAFAIAIAVMPLGGLLSGGVFETWLSGDQYRPTVHVALQDQTGLVRGLIGLAGSDGELDNPGGNQLALSVPILGGCGDFAVRLSFRAEGAGFTLTQQNDEYGCPFLTLVHHGTILISLWAPVDAASVRFDSPFVSVG